MKKIKIIFAGNDAFSLKNFKKIINFKYVNIVSLLISKIKKKKKKSEIEIFAKKKKINIIKINVFNKKIKKKIKKKKAKLLIVVSFGKIIPKKILKMFPLGGINSHASLLPKWRGCSPIQHSILFGDKKTGISIIQMNKKMDSGKIILQKKHLIKKKDTFISLSKKLSEISSKLLIKVLKKIILKKKINKVNQIQKYVTYTKKIKKQNGHINWNKKASKIEKMIRAYQPWPSSYFFINKKMVKIWKSKVVKTNTKERKKNKTKCGTIQKFNKNGIFISTKKDLLQVQIIQISGKKKNFVSNIYNSYKNFFKIGLKLK